MRIRCAAECPTPFFLIEEAAGAIIEAVFLSKFARGYPWAHLDIMGMMQVEETKGCVPKRVPGFGLRLLVEWLWATLTA